MLSEKAENKKQTLPVAEEFYSLQGEGFHTGKAAYFIRIAGCDLGCSWCDSSFTWDSSLFPEIEVDKIVENANNCPAKTVVVTGGEPLMQDLDYLCKRLKENGITTLLETSGAYPLSGKWDWICLSPKKQAPPLNNIYPLANELKVIVANNSDLNWAMSNAKKVSKNCHLYLQPEWSVHKSITQLIVNFIKQNPQWQISLQSHKFMGIP